MIGSLYKDSLGFELGSWHLHSKCLTHWAFLSGPSHAFECLMAMCVPKLYLSLLLMRRKSPFLVFSKELPCSFPPLSPPTLLSNNLRINWKVLKQPPVVDAVKAHHCFLFICKFCDKTLTGDITCLFLGYVAPIYLLINLHLSVSHLATTLKWVWRQKLLFGKETSN